MQVSFSLRKDKTDKNGLIPIRALITFKGVRIRRVIKNTKTTLKHWNNKNQRIKAPLKSEPYNYHIEYNKILDEFDDKVKKIFRYILLNNITPTKEFILDKLEKEEEINLYHDFFISFKEFIDKSKNTKAERTIKSYVTTINFIKDFTNETSFEVRFDTIDYNFYEKFQDYAFEKRETKNNYFGKLITIIKTFMTWSFERNYHENLDYKKFKVKEDSIEVIYLTMVELLQLYNFKFENQRLERVKDFYCFGCFTGLRFSDIKQLKPSNIFENEVKLNIQKTKTIDHKIPLNKYSKEILEKYKETIYEPLPTISSQKFNKYIKECCKIVGINTSTNITRYIGTKRIDKTVPKYELITSHTARKTFVTNSLILGMKEMVVRNITGHKKEESFKKYVQIAEDFKRQEMDNTWDKI